MARVTIAPSDRMVIYKSVWTLKSVIVTIEMATMASIVDPLEMILIDIVSTVDNGEVCKHPDTFAKKSPILGIFWKFDPGTGKRYKFKYCCPPQCSYYGLCYQSVKPHEITCYSRL